MRDPDPYGVVTASGRVPYADGAEEAVLRDLLECVDRSDGSDELAARIRDWPTMYHFSPLRTNVLRPLTIRPGMRVLEVGCGTGAITRWLGEQGAEVIAIEGNVHRARAAAVRCAGLSNVEVVAGTFEDLSPEATFDLTVLVGVLEYATVFGDVRDGPKLFLEPVAQHLGADGAVVLAIENQLGLKYLLGYGEDHLGLPWVGIEGYAKTSGPRTWSRKVLQEMLQAAGLAAQRWLFPFPDYKLPTVVIDERLYEWPAGDVLIDQLVRSPVSAQASAPQLLCDARLAHRQLLRAGLGPDVANSFLVVAGRAKDHVDALLGSELAWLFSDARRRQWRRQRAVIESPDGLEVADRGQSQDARALAWLRQVSGADVNRPLVHGEPLDLLILDGIRRNDLHSVSKLLSLWRAELESQGQLAEATDQAHPFAPVEGSLALPEDFLDVLPSNFILNAGSLTFIDREWAAPGPVRADLVEVRALWYFARELVEVGDQHPWGSLATVEEICVALCGLAGVRCTKETLARWRQAEAELQHLVSGADVALLADSLESGSGRRTLDVSPRAVPFTTLRASLDAARKESEALNSRITQLEADLSQAEARCAGLKPEADAAKVLREEADELRKVVEELDGRVAKADAALIRARAEVTSLEERLEESNANATALGHEVNRLKREVQAWSERVARIERRLPVRVYRALRRLASPT